MQHQKRLSFELFPPKTAAGAVRLAETRAALSVLAPEFFSVTYGAGGSTRDNTRATVMACRREGRAVAPHLSFGVDGEASVLSLLEEYRQAGVERIVALRGDMPSGMGMVRLAYASELVAFIRRQTGDYFHLEVAAYPEIHPEAKSYAADISFLKAKLDAGANSVITQYFFNADAFERFMDACLQAGIEAPIYPGIMPITNYQNLARFSAKCGADIPRWLARRLEGFADDEASLVDFGVDVVSRLCERLLASGAPGLHFYTMNQVHPTLTICENVGMTGDRS